MGMYQYKDAFEFQEKFPTKEEKERELKKLSDDEIWHLAKTCTNVTGSAWYARHMKDPHYKGS